MAFLAWLGVALLPTLLTALGLLLCRLERRVPAPTLPEAAGPWIERFIAKTRRSVGVEVVPADSPDAYWPEAATIGVSEATYGGRSPRDWAVVAHELGHAETLRSHPLLPWLLPGARLSATLGWRFAIAGLLTALLFHEPAAAWFALGMLALSVLASAVVCADEALASWHGYRFLAEDGAASDEARKRAGTAMAAAGSAYLLGALGQLLVLALWPFLTDLLVGTPTLLKPPSDLGVWLVIAGTPVVAVRVVLALRQVIAPEPVPSELDLWDLLSREAKWESAAAVGVLGMVLGMHAAVGGPVTAVASALGLAVALGPLHGLLLALCSLPVVVMRRLRGTHEARSRVRYLREARDDVPQALLAMWESPPWYLRAVWLLPLAYLPIVAVLAARVLGET